MSSNEYPPKSSDKNPLEEADRIAIEEIGRKLAKGLPLSPSEQARAGLGKFKDSIRLATIRAKESIGREMVAAKRAVEAEKLQAESAPKAPEPIPTPVSENPTAVEIPTPVIESTAEVESKPIEKVPIEEKKIEVVSQPTPVTKIEPEPMTPSALNAAIESAKARLEARYSGKSGGRSSSEKEEGLDADVTSYVKRIMNGELMSSAKDQAFLSRNFKIIKPRFEEMLLADIKRKREQVLQKQKNEERALQRVELEKVDQEDLQQSLEREGLSAEGTKKQLIDRLMKAGMTKVEDEPLEDFLTRGFEKPAARMDAIIEKFDEDTKTAPDKIVENMGNRLDPRMERLGVIERRMMRKIDGDTAKKLGVALEERPHFEVPVVVSHLVPEAEQKVISETEKSRFEIPVSKRRRIGFKGEGIGDKSSVRVETDGSTGELVASYETRKDPGATEVVTLTGEKSKNEEYNRSIFDKYLDKTPLTKEQRYMLDNNPLVRKRVDIQKERHNEKYESWTMTAARDMIAGRDLTDAQVKFMDDNPEAAERINKMVRERKLETGEDFDLRGLPKIFDKLEERYKEAGLKMPSDKDIEKRIPNYSSLDKTKKAKAMEEWKERWKKNHEFDEDDLLGTEGYIRGKNEARNISDGKRRDPSVMKPVFDSIDNSAKEKLLIANKSQVAEIFRKMNLNKEKMLKENPEFFYLEEPQQIYVLEKLRQKINGDATLDAEMNVEKLLDRKTTFLTGDWWKKQFQKLTAEKGRSEERKRLLEEEKKTNLENYQEDLGALIAHVKDMPFPISYDESGKLSIQYENQEDGASTPTFIKEFNEAATAMSEMPYEWTLPTATAYQKKEYKKILESYEIKKRILLDNKRGKYDTEKDPDAEAKALLWVASVDNSVKMNQLLTSHPDLDNLQDKSWMSNPEFQQTALRNSVFTFGGAGARWLSRKTFMFGGGLVAVSAIGAFLAGRKEYLKYNEVERRLRYGISSKQEDLSNVKPGFKKFVKNLQQEFDRENGVKKFADAKHSAERIRDLIDRLDNSEDENEMEKIATLLRNRVYVVDERINSGRMNYGEKKSQMVNKLNLMQVLAEAKNKIYMAGGYDRGENEEPGLDDISGRPKNPEMLDRLNRVVKDSKATRMKVMRIAGKSMVGAVMGGTAYTVSYGIADWWERQGTGQGFMDRVKEMRYEGGDGKWDDVEAQAPLQGVPHDYKVGDPDPFTGKLPYDDVPKPPVVTAVENAGTEAPVNLDDVPTPPEADLPVESGADVPDADQGADTDVADNTSAKPPFAGREMWRGDKVLLQQYETENFDMERDASGKLTSLEAKDSVNEFAKVKEYLKNPRNFVDFSRIELPKNFENPSWGIQALAGSNEEIKEFLATQELLEKVQKIDPGSPDIEVIKNRMTALGEQIESRTAEFISRNSGKVTEGNIFSSYTEWLGKERLEKGFESGFDNATASLEGAATIDNPLENVVGETAPETPVATTPEATPTVETTPTPTETTPVPESVSVESGYNVEKTPNSVTIHVDNEYMKGDIELTEADGKIGELMETDDYKVDPDKYFEQGWKEGLSEDEIRMKQANLHRFLNHQDIIDKGVLDKADPSFSKAIERRMAFNYNEIESVLDEKYKLSPEGVKGLSESTGIPIEVETPDMPEVVSTTSPDGLEIGTKTPIELPDGSSVLMESEADGPRYTYDSDKIEGDIKVKVDPRTGATRLIEHWNKFDRELEFNDANFARFITVDPTVMAKKFSMDESVGKQLFNALMKDYIRYDYLLSPEGGIDKSSVAGKAILEAIEDRKAIFLKKTGQTLESILRTTK